MGTFHTNLLPHYSTLKMEAEYSFETPMNVYQNIRSHIPKGPDYDTARKMRRLEHILQAILKKYSVRLGKGLKWLKLEKKCKIS